MPVVTHAHHLSPVAHDPGERLVIVGCQLNRVLHDESAKQLESLKLFEAVS
ncbi:MAG: hypothetical protein IH991_21025 [Planctomycetes bacterium]|nr:hypothetical protein [Planctomycetota bacterium]